MPAVVDNAKHRVSFTVAGTAANRLNSMISAGPLLVQAENWFASSGADWLPPAAGGNVSIDYHMLEYVLMDGFMLEGPVMNLDQGWFFPPPLLTQFMADLDAAGISWAKGAPDELRRRVAVCAKSLLGLADRTVSLAPNSSVCRT